MSVGGSTVASYSVCACAFIQGHC